MVTASFRIQDRPVAARRPGLQQLAEHARRLAARRCLATGPVGDGLAPRLQQAARWLQEAHSRFRRAAEGGSSLPPAGAWLLDNYRSIRDQIETARRQLPRRQGRALPLLAAGPRRGLPRVYELAVEFIAHSGTLDRECQDQFFTAYQSLAPLALDELWSTANMLRLALIESLCRVALRAVRRGSTAAGPARPGQQDQDPETRAMRNGLSSLRALGFLDWREFVAAQSVVERALREDPAGAYSRMDFAGCDHYRHIVQRLARRSMRTELEVAQCAVARARSARRAGAGNDRCHVGYYLVDEGRMALEEELGCRRGWQDVLVRRAARAPLSCYLGGVLVLWLLALALAAAEGWQLGLGRSVNFWSGLVLLALLAGAATQFAVNIVNWLCTMIVPPRPLMRLDFSRGIPAECRTLVAVPAMLASQPGLRALVEQLERRFLANRDDNILFALLTDFPDALAETLPGDRRLLALARAEIRRLNRRYCRNRPTIFYLLHRPRQWNRQQGAWMAEERKRGKLAALNRLVLTADGDAFSATVGDLSRLSSVRYVITLDADTRLPRDVARELAGCMAHPLNRPQIDPQSRRVVKGYAILQPRVGVTVSEANHSPFSRWLAGDPGIDPYTRQTSDVYQDVFGQGSFIGKGIYDVQAFSTALDGRFPANRVLSHDLIEGCFARSGLVNDVELFEGLPAHYLADMGRRHRWIRGDWQIAAWLCKRVPTAQGMTRNPLDGLARWKILDNLRRSLMPPLLLGLLLAGWTSAPELAGYWTLLALLLACAPPVAACLPAFLRKPLEKPWLLHLKDQGARFLDVLAIEAFSWCVLPYASYRHLDAVARTLYRLCVSRRGLLEWVPASEAEARCPRGFRAHYQMMWACAAISAAAAILLAVVAPRALPWAGPMLLAWLAGPLIAWCSAQPGPWLDAARSSVPQRQVRRWARQTWHYFETFMNEQEHWLPPDNVQTHSPLAVATRTSPTNIGMGLLSGLAAYDLGYLPGTALVQRTRGALDTMLRLERCRGHLYNWYDTRTLRPIEPRYVSSVDSGNLWGALTVLAVGLDELRDRPLVPPRFVEGLQDTLEVIAVLRSEWPAVMFDDPFDACLEQLRRQCAGSSPASARCAHEVLCRVRALAATLATAAPANRPALRQWTKAFLQQAATVHQELLQWAFWLRMSPRPPAGEGQANNSPRPPAGEGQGVREVIDQPALNALHDRLDRLDAGCTLGELPRAAEQVVDCISRLLQTAAGSGNGSDDRPGLADLSALRRAAEQAALAARRQRQQIVVLAGLCRQFCGMDFRFLFHPQRKLLSIGFQVSGNRPDDVCYDLLASEARLASFLAISHGQVPPDHWFALGRAMTLADGKPVLLSWAGSVFEYLMPALLMPSYAGTLLAASCGAAVRRHIRYARRQGVPWGISESCYNRTDANRAYQYRAHGAPGLGLKRGLGENLVVAPYASAMAMMVSPREASCNLMRLEQQGCLSPHGFYDAIDFTPQSPAAPLQAVPCRIVMAHHSGMTLLALDNVLLAGPMPRRFLKTPACAAHDLLLQERMPQAIRPVLP